VEPGVRFPAQYFNFKEFRKQLKAKRENLGRAEVVAVRREFAKPAPRIMVEYKDPKTGQIRQKEQWMNVYWFCKKMRLSSADHVAARMQNFFPGEEGWKDFVSLDKKELCRLHWLCKVHKRRLLHYLNLFNHGLWPEPEEETYRKTFAGRPYSNAGTPWTPTDDEHLTRACEHWGVYFGDPWLYISADLDRPMQECRYRWLEISVKPKQKEDVCEFALTKCTRPLLMNRQFRMLPPACYIIPSEKNFPLAKMPEDSASFSIPAGFAEYRDKENWMRGGVRRGVGGRGEGATSATLTEEDRGVAERASFGTGEAEPRAHAQVESQVAR